MAYVKFSIPRREDYRTEEEYERAWDLKEAAEEERYERDRDER